MCYSWAKNVSSYYYSESLTLLLPNVIKWLRELWIIHEGGRGKSWESISVTWTNGLLILRIKHRHRWSLHDLATINQTYKPFTDPNRLPCAKYISTFTNTDENQVADGNLQEVCRKIFHLSLTLFRPSFIPAGDPLTTNVAIFTQLK